FVINLTNDSWYGDTAEPFQHQFLAHWRAIEFLIPVIRSTNTGITSVLLPDGSQSKYLNINEENVLDIELKLINNQPTIFQQFGNKGFILIVIFLLTFNSLDRFFRRR
ncbi:hypothetical protein OAB57_04120, partial [Bacteriovoracaceae bacterium]|nr:hypothetical protein [Bacteriovoracaceae bacterium]